MVSRIIIVALKRCDCGTEYIDAFLVSLTDNLLKDFFDAICRLYTVLSTS